MMPSATYPDLFIGPYVKKDPQVKSLASQDVVAAAASLESLKAKLTPEGKDDPAATMLAYQTMYQCAKALIHHAGYHITNFRALVSAVEKIYVATHRLDQALVDGLVKSQGVQGGTAHFAAQAEQWVQIAKGVTGR